MSNSFIALVYTHEFPNGYRGRIWQRSPAGYNYEIELLWNGGHTKYYPANLSFEDSKALLMQMHYAKTHDDIEATYILSA